MKSVTLFLAVLVSLLLAQEWSVTYSSGPDINDEAVAVAVDSYGNCYVLGRTQQATLVKYDPQGETLWTRTTPDSGWNYRDSMDLALDQQGNPVLAVAVYKGDSNAFHLAKYQSNGDAVWSTTYWHPQTGPHAVGPVLVGTTDEGDIYIAGCTGTDSTYEDVITCRFLPTGAHRWTRVLDGPRHSYDRPGDLVVVDAGRIVVGAKTTDAANDQNLSMLCYDSTGVLLWDYYYMRDASYSSVADGCDIGPDGSVYVAGWRSQGTDTEIELLLVKLSPNGDSLWAAAESASDGLFKPSLVADTMGNVYVVATFERHDTMAMKTWKFSPAGTKLWQRTCLENDSFPTMGHNAILAADQGVYACGVHRTELWRWEYLVAKYRPNGNEAWRGFREGSRLFRDWLAAGAVDPDDNIVVTGWTDSAPTGRRDFLTTKFRATGGVAQSGRLPAPDDAIEVSPSVVAKGCEFRCSRPARLRIVNLTGRTVAELASSGETVRWDLAPPDGQLVPNGVYFAVAEAPGFRAMVRFIVHR